MSREKRLGRGLEALLGKVAVFEDNTSYEAQDRRSVPLDADDPERILQESLKSQTPSQVDIMSIDRNPYQPRKDFDEAELDALSASIATHGLLQPIVVRPHNGRYQIIAGERRYRGAIRAGWSEIPVYVLDVDDRQMAELALTENLQRKDLNALEKATAFARYLEVYGGTQEELAARLEVERSTVCNLIRLLHLADEVQTMLHKEELTPGHARTLVPLEEWEQVEFARRIVNEDWSVRQTEKAVKEYIESGNHGEERPQGWGIIDQDGNRKPLATDNAYLLELEQEFRHHLGTKVKLTQTDSGKGKLVIPFHSHEDFERIYKWICKNSKYKDAG